ncbi:MAG: flagellar type III secretion system pore protein FliP [Clostridiales bacterium]|nr:flagellar type III secretion system pore protein FliP [Clostridiales bacterium]
MRKKLLVLFTIIFVVIIFSGCSLIDETDGTSSDSGPLGGLLGDRSESLDIIMLLTVLTILPSILIMMTGFTRIIIVLSLIRNGLGLQQMPPNQVLVGLALFITFFVMSPVIEEVKINAYEPYIQEVITQEEALDAAMVPIREFMLRQTYKKDLDYFISVSSAEIDIESVEEISNTALFPAFITSEIKRGFQIGFFLYIPFIVMDMIVASTLMSMGMMMLPPIVISLPFKLLLFVMVDGWMLTVQTLIASFT